MKYGVRKTSRYKKSLIENNILILTLVDTGTHADLGI